MCWSPVSFLHESRPYATKVVLVCSKADCCSVTLVRFLMNFSEGACVHAFPSWPLPLVRSLAGSWRLLHFQGFPGSKQEAVQGDWVQCQAPLCSNVKTQQPGMQHLHPSGRSKQSPGAFRVWKQEDLIMAGSYILISRHIKQQVINLH